MKVIIIDDELAMHLIMNRMLGKIDEVEIMGSFQETAAAFAFLQKQEIDMIFMDISMPKESGLEFAQRLREQGSRAKLVFVTSHKEYALPAFGVYAYDYMVKPVMQERLRQTILKALSEGAPTMPAEETKAAPTKVLFNCLGRMEIRSAHDEIVKWKTSKSAELFGYLSLHKGRLVSRARLIEDIFGGMPRKNAESYLNTTAYQLRKLLETNGLKGSLHSDGVHYGLNLNEARFDMFSFEEGCKQMGLIHDENIEEALELEQLYVGDLFGDRAYPWAWSEIERFSQMYIAFSQRLCSALLQRGDTASAIRLLTKQTLMNELDEETIKLLMSAHAMQKNKVGLVHQYIKFVDMLHDEMGVSPSLEITMLYERLLRELDTYWKQHDGKDI
ncbi:response regulator [Paenibacillus algorifonticola]|uniref:response regulator n=1 Tax=Paenibacillus algorifonticola TaxID=684063 RepID=UPI003D2CA08C